MRRKITLLCMLTTVAISYAQESFSGFRTSNYNGVYGTLSNPTNIASSHRKWDFNLISINFGVGGLGSKGISTILNSEKLKNSDVLNNNEYISASVNMDILGPSIMYRINKNHSVAFTSRTRVVGNINNIDTDLYRSIIESKNDIKNTKFPITIKSNEEQKAILNGWSEYGLSWAGTVFQKENHTIKVGVTLKYLKGSINSYANINRIEGRIEEDSNKQPYLTDAKGELSLVSSGVNLKDFKANHALKSVGTGFGADLGMIYEFRDKDEMTNNYNENYKFRVGIALLDIGGIKYNPLKDQSFRYSVNIPNSEKLYLRELENDPEKTLNNSDYVKKTDKSEAYKVSLPTALRLSADYHIYNNFFVALDTQLSAAKKDDKNPHYTNNFVVTPRYETAGFGAYLPIGYDQLSGTNIGAAFRMGPVFFGSGSVLSSLAGSGKQIDLFLGLRFGR